jgi:flavin-dependent dehydrogenase
MNIDVIIIGGSLAGASCALELRRLGIDALALDRDVFPRERVCGGFLSPNALDRLAELELLNTVRAAGAVEVDHARMATGDLECTIPFRRKGLGISRSTLDHILANAAQVQQATTVRNVSGNAVETNRGSFTARVVIDAAGKLSRFTPRRKVPEFGVQYLESGSRGSSLDFWFFDDGYGGAVTVEGARSNFCFLIKKDALARYVSKANRLITGPLAYDRSPGWSIAIGDAAGMIDPFCGEGMHHALDSGITAARIVARGLREKRSYAEMKQTYELEWARRWSAKRMLASMMRLGMRHPVAVRLGLSLKPGWFLDHLWATIPACPG